MSSNERQGERPRGGWFDWVSLITGVVTAGGAIWAAAVATVAVRDATTANTETGRHIAYSELLTVKIVRADSVQNELVAEAVRNASDANSLSHESNAETRKMAAALQRNNVQTDVLAAESRRPWIEFSLNEGGAYLEDSARVDPPANSAQDTLIYKTAAGLLDVKQIGGGPARTCMVFVHLDSTGTSAATSTWFQDESAVADTYPRFPVGSTSWPATPFSARAAYHLRTKASAVLHIVALMRPRVGDETFYYEQTYRVADPVTGPRQFVRWQVWYGRVEESGVVLE